LDGPGQDRFGADRNQFAPPGATAQPCSSIYGLQAILGHKSIKTTEIHLDFLAPETTQRAIRWEFKSA
jgi:hypothetical protein